MENVTKVCTKCKEEKDREASFYKSSMYRDGYYSQCKDCRKKLPSQTPDMALKKMYRSRERNHAYVYEYLKDHPCVDCGESDIVVLEFDHVRGKKAMNVSQMIHNTFSLERVREEMAKCEVVCANCHRRRTAVTQGWNKGTH